MNHLKVANIMILHLKYLSMCLLRKRMLHFSKHLIKANYFIYNFNTIIICKNINSMKFLDSRHNVLGLFLSTLESISYYSRRWPSWWYPLGDYLRLGSYHVCSSEPREIPDSIFLLSFILPSAQPSLRLPTALWVDSH